MGRRIEDHALIGDTQTAALVAKDGSIDWLCLPRFDSPTCFAALLGTDDNGHWSIAPSVPVRSVRRRYRPQTLVLETEFVTDEGVVRLTDAMPIRGESPVLVRLVQCVTGRVPMHLELVVRFLYGSVVPWVHTHGGRWAAVAGPDALVLDTPVHLQGQDLTTVADFTLSAGEDAPFALAWHPSHQPAPVPTDPAHALEATEAWWRRWHTGGRQPAQPSPWAPAVERSLITLKALTHAPTGGIIAAPTTSLPEHLGGVRNWDYRYCWLRDATFTLYALLMAGYTGEASAWRDWMLRAVAGTPSTLQTLYGPAGERYLAERELSHLAGYEGSRPVRVGNLASEQFQLDVYGEVLDCMYQARRTGLPYDEHFWDLEQGLVTFVEANWRRPDSGIWEMRGGEHHFTHSKVMAWVALDRAVRSVERYGMPGPVDRWRRLRDEIHDDVCTYGVDPERGTFVQRYGSTELDAALLLIPLVGFLPPGDARVQATAAAIERELMVDGFVLRYRTDDGGIDGLPPGDGCFLPCTLWLADNHALSGRSAEASLLLGRVLDVANDVGLLAEEYDPRSGRQLGNFPQAFSHVAVVNTARNLGRARPAPATHRPALEDDEAGPRA